MPKMHVLSDQEIQELDDDDRYRFCLIKDVITEDRTVDQSRTRFLRYNYPVYVSTKTFNRKLFIEEAFVCEIRRNDSSKLDLDVLFHELDPMIAAGPPFEEPFDPSHPYGQLWEPYYMGDTDLKEHMDLLRPFLRDWLSGRFTVTTRFVDDVPCRLILKRGDEVIGVRRDRKIRFFDKSRDVTQQT